MTFVKKSIIATKAQKLQHEILLIVHRQFGVSN